MFTVDLQADERQTLLQFIEEESFDREGASCVFDDLLGKIMSTVDVRRLEQVNPDDVREMLTCIFALFKAKHLAENNFLSVEQYELRLKAAKDRLNAALLEL
ncbi:hypothetical protein EY643_12820 [Halioglobus maricola]|uniref:Uncharacterized protein n=1 Tax=Halioglobus maricola TaxID=2601894 RepID=A0A5P9NLH1_9GAMM|nr:hypothetical protein [Halioglobus maricola]QFU76469.1 hypothetical protein EY643_12820 [Halioglobus maricola]